jgi:hypothetical protein
MPTFYNQATLSYNGRLTNSNVTEGELLEAISITKTAISSDYGAAGGVVYSINILNSGNSAANGLTVTDNGELTYTFVIQNMGNTAAVATDDVILADNFNPILSDISVTYNGAVWTAGTNYTYSETTGEFASLPGQITVPGATYAENPETGAITVTPGVTVITVTGTV